MNIPRYHPDPKLTPEDRARMAEGLCGLAQQIAQDADERWLDARVPLSSPEDLARMFGRLRS